MRFTNFSLWFCLLGILLSIALQAQEGQSLYPVAPVYPPELVRPASKAAPQMLREGISGILPEHDGESFRLNIRPAAGAEASVEGLEQILSNVLAALNWTRDRGELQPLEKAVLAAADKQAAEAAIAAGEAQTRKELEGRFGKLNAATEQVIEEQAAEARRLTAARQEVYGYQQYFQNVPLENTGVRIIWRSDQGYTGITGRLFNQINLTNARRLNADAASKAARDYFKEKTEVGNISTPLLVILPYGEGFRYSWRMDVEAAEGPYRAWIDAGDGKVLRLEPQFFYDSASGLVFNPNPNAGTDVKTFEVDAPSGSNYRLRLNGVLDVNNNGADGQCSGDLTIADDGSGSANFNVNPINGTVVDRTGNANYNCRFQEVNTYAWVYNHIQTITQNLGGQPLPSITATVNHNNPCGFGINNACANSNSFTLTFGIGGATGSNSTSCNQLFNSAIDATVVTHEFGHLVNANQYAVSGGNMTGAINEGLADFWAYTLHGTDTFGAWWNRNCPAPVQTSSVPRQAEAQDIFPEHRINFGDGFPHTDGQIISWALWSSRQEFQAISALGVFLLNTNLLTAMTTAGVGVATGNSFRRVHDSYLNLLQQMAPLFATSRNIHKLLSGFARAGFFLAPQDAVIDIGDDFINRNDPGAPTFTVWTGRDYAFFANGNVDTGTQPFNTRFTVEVANDEAFTVNLVSSGVQAGVVAGAGGVGTWTIPAADWNVLKAQDQIFYRVTTTDNAGGTVRTSTNPGNSTLTGVPPGRATINETGECTCACGASAATPRTAAAVTLLPLLLALLWRRRIRKEGNDETANR